MADHGDGGCIAALGVVGGMLHHVHGLRRQHVLIEGEVDHEVLGDGRWWRRRRRGGRRRWGGGRRWRGWGGRWGWWGGRRGWRRRRSRRRAPLVAVADSHLAFVVVRLELVGDG